MNKRIAFIVALLGFLIPAALLLHGHRSVIVSGSPSATPIAPTYFAQVDKNGNVLRVIVADQTFINSGIVGDPTDWIQTDINGGTRKNYAGKGYTYDKSRNAFIPPQPSSGSFILNELTDRWQKVTPTP